MNSNNFDTGIYEGQPITEEQKAKVNAKHVHLIIWIFFAGP